MFFVLVQIIVSDEISCKNTLCGPIANKESLSLNVPLKLML